MDITMLIAEVDAVVERNEECVGISVNKLQVS
jgi:hypothetical protein